MDAETFYLTASDNQQIAVHRWLPLTKPRGIILISHGMAEYARRYNRFAEAALALGFGVYAPDHRGHGETAGSLLKLGYLADKNGFVRVMEDLHELTLEIQSKHPDTAIILLGHSFGSFVSQMYIENYGNLLSGCVLSGTRGPDPLLVFGGKIAANVVAFCCGKKKQSPFLTQLSFGTYNNRISNPGSPNSWLSRDTAEVEQYDVSPWAGFTCTAGFFQDLTTGLSCIHKNEALNGIPKNLPVFIICGAEDPVGQYGKTVKKLADILTGKGIKDLAIKIYAGSRHELLNEINRDEVTDDVLDWISGCIAVSPDCR